MFDKPERTAACAKVGLVVARHSSMSLSCPSLTSAAALVPFSTAQPCKKKHICLNAMVLVKDCSKQFLVIISKNI
jgi:hypothetical protein